MARPCQGCSPQPNFREWQDWIRLDGTETLQAAIDQKELLQDVLLSLPAGCSMRLLVTGGAGYVGSHTSLVLLQEGHEIVILDDFSNSDEHVVQVIRDLAGRSPELVKADIRDRVAVRAALAEGPYDAILHFAALKSAPESVAEPARYRDVNVGGMEILLNEALAAGTRNFVFSSSAIVYGRQEHVPITETAATTALNPYAATKLAGERMLREIVQVNPGFRACSLRYFNPVGGHPSGRLGENPRRPGGNLFPMILKACRERTAIEIHGADYDTRDGTTIRDFVHVMDLAEGHAAALEFLLRGDSSISGLPGLWTFNLGTGKGASVLELIATVEKVVGHRIECRIGPRREGDIVVSVADVRRAESIMGWRSRRTLEEACTDAVRSQEHSPGGT